MSQSNELSVLNETNPGSFENSEGSRGFGGPGSSEGSRGRALTAVWDFFERENTNSRGHFSAKCTYCSAKWARGEPSKLEAHLALECPHVDENIRQLYLLRVAHRNNIPNFFPQESGSLSDGRINSINNALVKAFV
ncbi:28752_t:CDS:2, partial [Racocetra persica]